MMTTHYLGLGMNAKYYPAIPPTRYRYGTIAHFRYYARKSRRFLNEISYTKLCEWTRHASEEVRSTFENHFNVEMNKETKWGLMVHPDSLKTIKELKSRDIIKNVRITMVFTAETDRIYTSRKFDQMIRCYFYVDNL